MVSIGTTKRYIALSSSARWADDQELDYETVPEHWVASGPGSPWLVFKLPIDPIHSGQTVKFEVLALLPEDVECRIETLLYHEWWNS